MRTVVWPLVLAAVAATRCLDPTQITLTLGTNAACDDVEGTAIVVGEPGQLEQSDPATTTTRCTSGADGGQIGSIVLIPSGADDAPVGVRVAMSLGGSLDGCINPPYADHCIIARRSLSFIPQTPLTLPIELDVDCAGTFCTELTTCVDGDCVDATVDPDDCVGPAGCVLQGTGGGGGAGGGSAGCGPPVTLPAVALTGAAVERDDVAIAVDAGDCSWAIAWSEVGTEVCTRLVRPDGQPSAAACDARPAVADVDVAPLGNGIFALADWGSEAHLSTATADGILAQGTLGAAVGGAIATRDDALLMVFEQSGGALGYATYLWDGSSLSPPTQQTPMGGHTGTGLDVAWGASDAVVSWISAAAGGQIARFPIGTNQVVGPVDVPATTNIALADHPPSGVTGIIFNDSGGNGELATWSPSGNYTSGGYSATDYSGTATGFAVTGTASGWVVAYIDGGRGLLTSFDSEAKYILTVREVAADATAIAIAAAGDQLGVAWLDSQGGAWFRRVAFDLSTL